MTICVDQNRSNHITLDTKIIEIPKQSNYIKPFGATIDGISMPQLQRQDNSINRGSGMTLGKQCHQTEANVSIY